MEMRERLVGVAIVVDPLQGIIAVQKNGRHANVIHSLAKAGCDIPVVGEQGFITSEGRFVDRLDGKKIAQAAGQCGKTEFNQLYSEDVW